MKIILGDHWYGKKRIIEMPCIACKKQIKKIEAWCYGFDNGDTFFDLCQDCYWWMIGVNFQ